MRKDKNAFFKSLAHKIHLAAFALLFLIMMVPCPALAVRPFVTDDAGVVGKNLFLLETSVHRNSTALTNLTLLAYGLTEKVELTLGFADGYLLQGEDSWRFSVAGPLGQVKYLLKEPTPNGYPGIAFVVGFGTPYGSQGFADPSWSQFAYLAFTESLGEKDRVLIHFNIGVNYSKPDDYWRYATTWGIGTQIRLRGGLHYVGEIFHGDPYAGDAGGAYQTGVRYFISERMQLDATFGSGLWGDNKPETFLGCGLRVIFAPPW